MRERFYCWLAWYLPRGLARCAFIRVAASGTVGKYGDTIVSELTCLQALERWSYNEQDAGHKNSQRRKSDHNRISPEEAAGFTS